jgi:hypothetical protein
MHGKCSLSSVPAMNSQRAKEETSTLAISNVPVEQLQRLQRVLVECGAVQILDTQMLGVRVFYNKDQ